MPKLQYPLFKDKVVWLISAKWVTRRHRCNVDGIRDSCGGRCCSSKSFWPPKAFVEDNKKNGATDRWVPNGIGLKNELYGCGYLGIDGCDLNPSQKPITCLLYPLKLNNNNKLVGHSWSQNPKGLCRANANSGPMIIDVLRGNLICLFGVEQVNRVTDDVKAGNDSYFIVPPDVWDAYVNECELESTNSKPKPRG